jgi:hypothetical protein
MDRSRMNAVILVPRRDDNGPRDKLWQWCRGWWEREQSHLPIIEGHHTEGLFSRSSAINLAAKIAGDWDVAVIIDSDVICDPDRVKEAVDLAYETGKLVLPHTVRNDLDRRGSQKVMNGYSSSWEPFVHQRYSVDNGHPSVSSVVVVPRSLWDMIGGFDESFRGWGYEDTAFAAAAETFAGIIRMPGTVWHLWHPTATEGRRGSTTHAINAAKGQRYRAAIGQPDLIRRLQAEGRVVIGPEWRTTIPRILHRVVPEKTTPQVEQWWSAFEDMHPGWELKTHRDPLAPKDWPETSPYWGQVRNGAQLADLIRLEALLRWGGVYVDSDCQPLRSFEPLMSVPAFAAWEDSRCVPNAVLGATAQHPAIRQCLELAIERLPEGTWAAGPGVTTDVLVGRPDVLLLPPQAFYGVHYRDRDREALMPAYSASDNPWAFVLHHYAYSWKGSE